MTADRQTNRQPKQPTDLQILHLFDIDTQFFQTENIVPDDFKRVHMGELVLCNH